jgi:uncharacterized protein (DUF4415 family)
MQSEHEVGEVPELGPEWFAKAGTASEVLPPELVALLPVKAMGRPRLASPKVPLTMRVDQEVRDTFKATGRGWQTRMNNVLRDWARTHLPAA